MGKRFAARNQARCEQPWPLTARKLAFRLCPSLAWPVRGKPALRFHKSLAERNP